MEGKILAGLLTASASDPQCRGSEVALLGDGNAAIEGAALGDAIYALLRANLIASDRCEEWVKDGLDPDMVARGLLFAARHHANIWAHEPATKE